MINLVENQFCIIWLKEGILYFKCKPIPYLDIEISQILLASRLLCQDGRVYPIFCDSTDVLESSKLALDYLAKEGSLWTKAIAIYNPGYLASFSHRHYLHQYQPLTPSAFFSEYPPAIEFLKQYLND